MKKFVKEKGKIFFCILLTVMVTMLAPFKAFALGKAGGNDYSLTIKCNYDGKPVKGVRFDLYKAAEVGDDGKFVPCGDFKDVPFSFKASYAEEWRTLSDYLTDYAVRKNIPVLKQKASDAKGEAEFTKLSEGLYLINGHSVSDGKFSYTPGHFLAVLPGRGIDGSETAHLIVQCKGEGAGRPGEEGGFEPPDLIQTGQLNWPVPMLAAFGMILFAAGWALTYIKKQKKPDK